SNDYARTVAGAIAGGTISAMTGGKFASGAMSGAMQAAMMGGGPGEQKSRRQRGDTSQGTKTGAPTELLDTLMRSEKSIDRLIAAKAAIKIFGIEGEDY